MPVDDEIRASRLTDNNSMRETVQRPSDLPEGSTLGRVSDVRPSVFMIRDSRVKRR